MPLTPRWTNLRLLTSPIWCGELFTWPLRLQSFLMSSSLPTRDWYNGVSKPKILRCGMPISTEIQAMHTVQIERMELLMLSMEKRRSRLCMSLCKELSDEKL